MTSLRSVRRLLVIPVMLLGLWLAGCAAEDSRDYRLSASSPVAVAAGQESSATVSATRVDPGPNSFAVGVSVSGCPAGATCQFTHAQIALPPMAGSQQNTSTFLVVRTQPSLAAGTYPLTIQSSGGGVNHTTTTTLTVSPAASFELTSVSPGLQILTAGETTTYTVTVTQQTGTAGAVALSVTDCPAGTTCAFNPANVTPTTAGATSTLTVATTLATPVGKRSLTLSGTGQGITRTNSVLLSVRVPGDVVGQILVKGRVIPISLSGQLCAFVGTNSRYDVHAECGCQRLTNLGPFASVNDLEEAIAQALNQVSVQGYSCVSGVTYCCPCTGSVVLFGFAPTCPPCSCNPSICFSVELHRCF